MCPGAPLIIQMLLPFHHYPGAFIRLANGKHKFIPFGCLSHEESKQVIPTRQIFDKEAFTRFIKKLERSIQHDKEGSIFIEIFEGDARIIACRKIELDNSAVNKSAA